MSGDFMEMILEVVLPERLSNELQKDKQYNAAIAEEERLYELLNSTLTEEKQVMLKDYFFATKTTSAKIERIAYAQGMRDFLSIFNYLGIN